MKNSSYYIVPVGVRTHDLPHTLASNMGKVSHALTHSAVTTVTTVVTGWVNAIFNLMQSYLLNTNTFLHRDLLVVNVE